MSKRLTLDQTWTECLKMWKWIVKERKVHPRKKIYRIKNEYFEKNKLKRIGYLCFFCEYASNHPSENGCGYGLIGGMCPANKIDKEFSCCGESYDCYNHPDKFYAKLLKLNKIRLKRKAKK